MNKHKSNPPGLVELLRSVFPKGTRVELKHLDDPYADIPAGTQGTVVCVDAVATIHVAWDNGSNLGLIYGVDHFCKV